MGTFQIHPSAKLTPELLLRQLLDQADEVENLTMVVQWKDSSYQTCWSQMKVGATCIALVVLQKDVIARLGEDPEEETE